MKIKSLVLLAMICMSAMPNARAQASAPALADNQVAVQFPNTNTPTISVTFCSADNSACETIPNMMLDSGSNGIRVFETSFTNPAIFKSFSTFGASGATLMTCTQAGGGESFWGYYAKANIAIGNIHGVNVPIQLMGESIALAPSNCVEPELSAKQWNGWNGVIGIAMGLKSFVDTPQGVQNNFFAMLCGANGCSQCQPGSGCPTLATLGLPADMNPIKYLASDNNGWILDTPTVPPAGAANVTATLTLGIGSAGRTNNIPEAGVAVFPINESTGLTQVQVNGSTLPTMFDTGTGEYSLPFNLNIPQISDGPRWFYNPAAPVNVTAQILAPNLSPAAGGQFQIGIFPQVDSSVTLRPGLATSQNDTGNTIAKEIFLAGYPFFIGRKVYYGLDGATTPLGVGPFNAFKP